MPLPPCFEKTDDSASRDIGVHFHHYINSCQQAGRHHLGFSYPKWHRQCSSNAAGRTTVSALPLLDRGSGSPRKHAPRHLFTTGDSFLLYAFSPTAPLCPLIHIDGELPIRSSSNACKNTLLGIAGIRDAQAVGWLLHRPLLRLH